LAKNWTLTIVPSLSRASAVNVAVAPTLTALPLLGAVSRTTGAPGLTGTMLIDETADTAWLPNESVTSALSA
jgi:hypothetical protein